MRLYEFADAAAQLALLRKIMDNTWAAVAQEAEQEQRALAVRKSKSKSRVHKPTSVPIPPRPVIAEPRPPLPQSGQAVKEPKPDVSPSVKSQIPAKPSSTFASSMLAKSNQSQPQSTPNAPKSTFSYPSIAAAEKDVTGTDRHSKNGVAVGKNSTARN